jgi:hypothetical protein
MQAVGFRPFGKLGRLPASQNDLLSSSAFDAQSACGMQRDRIINAYDSSALVLSKKSLNIFWISHDETG